jgi:hypothetical protein
VKKALYYKKYVAKFVIDWLAFLPRNRKAPRIQNLARRPTILTEVNMVFFTFVFLTLTEVFITLTEVFLTLTEVFQCFFFLSCKANATLKPAKTGHGPHSSTLFVIWVVLCIVCVNVYCHRVTTQMQLINISISVSTNTRQMAGCYLKLGSNRFLPRPLQFAIQWSKAASRRYNYNLQYWFCK